MNDAHLAVLEDRLRAGKEYRDWRAGFVGPTLPPLPSGLYAAITAYGDARGAMALTTRGMALQSAARAQELVAIHWRAVEEEYALLVIQSEEE